MSEPDYSKLSVKELEKCLNGISEQRLALRTKALMITKIRDEKAVGEMTAKRIAAMTPSERVALRRALDEAK